MVRLPEIESPFVVKGSALLQITAGVVVALIISPGVMALFVLAKTHIWLGLSSDTMLVLTVVLLMLLAVCAIVPGWIINRRKYALVDSDGIAIYDGDQLLQQARWSDLSFSRHGVIFLQIADASGRPLQLSYLQGSRESRRLGQLLWKLSNPAAVENRKSTRQRLALYFAIAAIISLLFSEVYGRLRVHGYDTQDVQQILSQSAVTLLQCLSVICGALAVLTFFTPLPKQ
jgi:hypothetical protein